MRIGSRYPIGVIQWHSWKRARRWKRFHVGLLFDNLSTKRYCNYSTERWRKSGHFKSDCSKVNSAEFAELNSEPFSSRCWWNVWCEIFHFLRPFSQGASIPQQDHRNARWSRWAEEVPITHTKRALGEVSEKSRKVLQSWWSKCILMWKINQRFGHSLFPSTRRCDTWSRNIRTGRRSVYFCSIT